jgi:hypothetical protein
LNTRFFIDADGIDGFRPSVMNRAFAIDRNVLVNQQDFLHLAVKIRIPFFQVVANLVGLDFVLIENAPDGGKPAASAHSDTKRAKPEIVHSSAAKP